MPDYQLTLNGKSVSVSATPSTTLLSLLRETLQLTGAKYGCGEGTCGACTVLVRGRPQRACQILVSQLQSQPITTIEGLAEGEVLHPVQQAFLDHEAFQCGFCTPGMILAATSLLAHTPHPEPGEIRRALNGHICRCGSYPRIVQAVQAAARKK